MDEIHEVSGNVYADLGLPDAEAMQAKVQLVAQLSQAIQARQWSPEQAADVLGLPASELSQVLRGQFPAYLVKDLARMVELAGITPDNLHPEISTGQEVSRERLTPYDAAECLTMAEAIAVFLAVAEKTGDPAYIANAREVAERARAQHQGKIPGKWIVEVTAYNRASDALRREFASLQHRVYQEPESDQDTANVELHNPVFDCLSFYVCDNGRVVSYAAVAMKTIAQAGDTFDVAGLSCVMTDPEYQGCGLGLLTVGAATRCMERSNLDFGIFTCDPPLAGFYAKAGAWPTMQNVVLIGSSREGALRSDTLGKVVLMRLFSQKAYAATEMLANATINLDLPVDQFL